ncbi:hypothetical protein JVU11DRAFT_10063 [Chiua virens]|nr:hypothetical protein JVU11DRAFT_10063 [Chiua virens]
MFKQMHSAAHELEDTKSLTKTEWEQRKLQYLSWLRTMAKTQKPKELKKYGQCWGTKQVIGQDYKEDIITIIRERWNAEPGSKMYLQHYHKGLDIVMEQWTAEELAEAKEKVKELNNNVLPDDIHAQNGDQLGRRFVGDFAREMWWQCGTQVFILAAWKDPKMMVRHDFNELYDAPPFKGLQEDGLKLIEEAWEAYSQKAFNTKGDGDGAESEKELPVKKQRRLTAVTHLKDSVPYLPDVREHLLAESKQLIWEFITGHYNAFFDGEFMLNGITLQEPSKLQKHKVNRILDLWKSRQDMDRDTVFQFHHTMNWTNEMVEAISMAQNHSNAEDDTSNAESNASGRPLLKQKSISDDGNDAEIDDIEEEHELPHVGVGSADQKDTLPLRQQWLLVVKPLVKVPTNNTRP